MTNELRLSAAIADEMISHAMAERPNEACGILAAKDDTVIRVFRMTNAQLSPLRYGLVPEEFNKVQNEIDDTGLQMIGGYHSHTRTEAYPSPTDVREAHLGDLLYLIVSLMNEAHPLIRAFQIIKGNMADETGEIKEIPVVVEGG